LAWVERTEADSALVPELDSAVDMEAHMVVEPATAAPMAVKTAAAQHAGLPADHKERAEVKHAVEMDFT